MSVDIFQDLLLPDEKIQWVARPKVGYLKSPWSIVISLLAAASIVFGLVHVIRRIYVILNFDHPIPWILFGVQRFDIFSLVIFIFGSIVLWSQIYRTRRLSNTHYALSMKRAFFAIGPSIRLDRLSTNIEPGGILSIGIERSLYRLSFSGIFGREEERNIFTFEHLGVGDFETALPIIKNAIGATRS